MNPFLKLGLEATKEFAKKEGVKQLGQKIGKEVGTSLVVAGAKGAGSHVQKVVKEKYSEKQDEKQKYFRLRKLITSTTSDIKDYKTGIEESRNVVRLIKYDIDSLVKIHPAYLAKRQRLVIKLQKWESLLSNLRSEAMERTSREAEVVYEARIESDFFEVFPEINSEILSANSKGELSKIILKVNKHYLKDFKQE